MKVLALEPYYGGSHKAFLDSFSRLSRHEWTLLTLPAYKWKWRMRHSAITFAQQVRELANRGENWDMIFCSDMLNLAEFLGLAPKSIKELLTIAYFHENQLTYPVQCEDQRDYQFAMTNLTTALAASEVWFNSRFHRDSFLEAIELFLKKMPDHQPHSAVETIKEKSQIRYPGITPLPERAKRKTGPVRILWTARWEHDKNPEDFFEALKVLKQKSIDFQVDVLGENFREAPQVFDDARKYFSAHINRWGYQPKQSDYEQALSEADIVVSTANHEFFGISVVEAISAGAYPLLPKRLAYPEILDLHNNPETEVFFYAGTDNGLSKKLQEVIQRFESDSIGPETTEYVRDSMKRFNWAELASDYDDNIDRLSSG